MPVGQSRPAVALGAELGATSLVAINAWDTSVPIEPLLLFR